MPGASNRHSFITSAFLAVFIFAAATALAQEPDAANAGADETAETEPGASAADESPIDDEASASDASPDDSDTNDDISDEDASDGLDESPSLDAGLLTCPNAPELAAQANETYWRFAKFFRLGTKWDATVRIRRHRPEEYVTNAQRAPLMPPQYRGSGAELTPFWTYESETRFHFEIPAAPMPITCELLEQFPEIIAVAEEELAAEGETLPDNPENLLIRSEILMAMLPGIMDLYRGVDAQGTHAHEEGEGFNLQRVLTTFVLPEDQVLVAPTCPKANPCNDKYFWKRNACPRNEQRHETIVEIGFEFDGGILESPDLSVLDDQHIELSFQANDNQIDDEGGTTRRRATQFESEMNPFTSDPCEIFNPVCKAGYRDEDVQCRDGFREFSIVDLDRAGAQLEEGLHILTDRKDAYFAVEFSCAEGCDCAEDSECDDGKQCTNDSCQFGQCRYDPDDSIVPEQTNEGDCLRCEDGRVKSVRAEAEGACYAAQRRALRACILAGSDNWLTNWTFDFAGEEKQSHYCRAGEVSASSTSPFCDGLGSCNVKEKVYVEDNAYSETCTGYNNNVYSFKCSVLCTSCLGEE